MQEEVYLTPNLFIKNKITYYDNDVKNKLEKVNTNNWHKYLSEYGWEKLDHGWIRRLNKYCQNKNKNSCWGVLDCGGEGDCLFHVIAEATDEPDMQSIRELAANQISDNNFEMIIEAYRTSYDANEFMNDWNPYDIKCKEELQAKLKEIGHSYWGDHIVIQLLEKALDVNFIVLNTENEENKRGTLKERFNIHSLGNSISPERKTIILYYIDSIHFKLVGYYNKTYMQKIFDHIPIELMQIYREDCCQ